MRNTIYLLLIAGLANLVSGCSLLNESGGPDPGSSLPPHALEQALREQESVARMPFPFDKYTASSELTDLQFVLKRSHFNSCLVRNGFSKDTLMPEFPSTKMIVGLHPDVYGAVTREQASLYGNHVGKWRMRLGAVPFSTLYADHLENITKGMKPDQVRIVLSDDDAKKPGQEQCDTPPSGMPGGMAPMTPSTGIDSKILEHSALKPAVSRWRSCLSRRGVPLVDNLVDQLTVSGKVDDRVPVTDEEKRKARINVECKAETRLVHAIRKQVLHDQEAISPEVLPDRWRQEAESLNRIRLWILDQPEIKKLVDVDLVTY